MPDLAVYVKYKLLDPDEVKELMQKLPADNVEEFKKGVLDNVVFNLKTDIAEALRRNVQKRRRTFLDVSIQWLRDAKSRS
jgi:oligoribonuclease (3'-5' exoribonuclease)